jgi:hypothetical protein
MICPVCKYVDGEEFDKGLAYEVNGDKGKFDCLRVVVNDTQSPRLPRVEHDEFFNCCPRCGVLFIER